MSTVQRVKQGIKRMFERHGSEVSACAKIAASALLPGGGILIESVGALCDYSADKGQDLTDERIMETLEGLGDDQEHLATLIGHLSGRLDDVMAQMVMLNGMGAGGDILERTVQTALATREDLAGLRQDMLAIQPELSFIQDQNNALLQGQAFAGDMLSQMMEMLKATQGYGPSFAEEGLTGPSAAQFMSCHQRFHKQILARDLTAAGTTLEEMRVLAPNGDTVKTGEMLLKGLNKDFEGAQRVSGTLSPKAHENACVKRITQHLSTITKGISSSGPSAESLERAMSFKAGAQVGSQGWKLVSMVGQGGMGAVWHVKNLDEEEGALKVMGTGGGQEAGFIQRFRQEIRTLKQISHPNVIDILDWGQDHATGGWYFVMPYIQGSSLGSLLSKGPLDSEEVKRIGRAVASGLVACHAQGVVHRDIKPDNIMLRRDGSPVLIDFGIAHQEGVGSGQTRMVTMKYAPPEQQAGEKVGAEADLYALGVTLADCFGGVKRLEGSWVELIGRLTHFNPDVRGSAEGLVEALSEAERAITRLPRPRGTSVNPYFVAPALTVKAPRDYEAMVKGASSVRDDSVVESPMHSHSIQAQQLSSSRIEPQRSPVRRGHQEPTLPPMTSEAISHSTHHDENLQTPGYTSRLTSARPLDPKDRSFPRTQTRPPTSNPQEIAPRSLLVSTLVFIICLLLFWTFRQPIKEILRGSASTTQNEPNAVVVNPGSVFLKIQYLKEANFIRVRDQKVLCQKLNYCEVPSDHQIRIESTGYYPRYLNPEEMMEREGKTWALSLDSRQ